MAVAVQIDVLYRSRVDNLAGRAYGRVGYGYPGGCKVDICVDGASGPAVDGIAAFAARAVGQMYLVGRIVPLVGHHVLACRAITVALPVAELAVKSEYGCACIGLETAVVAAFVSWSENNRAVVDRPSVGCAYDIELPRGAVGA